MHLLNQLIEWKNMLCYKGNKGEQPEKKEEIWWTDRFKRENEEAEEVVEKKKVDIGGKDRTL